MKSPLMSTKIGWGFTLALGAIAFWPSTHLVVVGLKIALVVALGVTIYVATTRQLTEKRVDIEIDGVERGTEKHYEQVIAERLSDVARISAKSYDGETLKMSLVTERSLAEMKRRVGKVDARLLDVSGDLGMSAREGQGSVVVAVHGRTRPNADIFIEGLDEPISADDAGCFDAEVPWTLVRDSASDGYIKGVARRNGRSEPVRIAVGREAA